MSRHKRFALAFLAAMTCALGYIVSLAYGAATGGHVPNIGMIAFGFGAILAVVIMLGLFAIDVIQSE